MKKTLKTALVLTAIGALALTGCSGKSGDSSNQKKEAAEGGGAGEWTPERFINMIVPWSAGGGSDLAVRTLVPYLEEDLGVSITVLNSTGPTDGLPGTTF